MEESRYAVASKLYVAVDCIIFGFDDGELKLLVFNRQLEPLKGMWSLIGSFVLADESAEAAGKRVLQEFTGLDDIFMEELKTYSEVERDPGARCISIGQYALIRLTEKNTNLAAQYGAKWFEVSKLPDLVLDHNLMVKDALHRLRNVAQFYPIGLELLPKKFTIPQLQRLYEELFQKKIDTRNFRKKLLSLNILIQLKEKDKSGSKKGAFLYEFDYVKYRKLKNKGFSFSLFKV
ncbi:NUDIX domain-containing protein [Cellulophaga sp. HaHa_2_95]|uniref:NUDIX hydrolase n=1 Tax=Cellulophaga sp. HaHa_2_95 TaxID=2745558 RepID=UPI002102CAC1|nr:NUDIX domain-containing protein [Cellulophaga sp. HaHa_2_95]